MNDNINKLIEESGIVTHFKTTNILRKNDWFTLVSPYYFDDISGAVRESDLIAEKRYDSGANWHSSVQLNIQLFVECKYIKQNVVFWFDDIDKDKAVSLIEKEVELEMLYGGRPSADIQTKDFHYFQNNSVAKLFSPNSNREDVIYKAMNQCLHSQIYYRKVKQPIKHRFRNNSEIFSKIIQYPMIVCDNFDNLLEVKFDDNNKFLTNKLKNHFILETNYRDEYFLIDIVDINYLEEFLKNFNNEAKQLINCYSFKQTRRNS